MGNLGAWLWKKFTEATVNLIITSGITSFAITLWAATRSSAPDMTSLGWLIVGVLLAFAIVILFGLAGWARQKWGRTNAPPSTAAAATPLATMLRIQTYSDARLPTRRQQENIWRWYTLSNRIRGRDANGTETDIAIQFFVFLVFETPVAVGQVLVSSPDMQLPSHEVKDSGPRHAIIVFNGGVSAGEIEVRVAPP
ncbi:hypothetical protein HYPDE_34483 [Hyphomicrobium denitrificans 1NES1]|uniref:Uncharacterized protein n=1 Tax=Hyphomicrobium denitrificans 1NES1 TaxID=670307 RepID=N0B6E7_9HYPH|nr:hypothetical protein [Hyphomicrobium denitrificans]AGK58568.1 hypothetical protein HYPDE_34483 [Hyphomicrobium denitrificans 1NES1]